jgi:hypothetical protein
MSILLLSAWQTTILLWWNNFYEQPNIEHFFGLGNRNTATLIISTYIIYLKINFVLFDSFIRKELTVLHQNIR